MPEARLSGIWTGAFLVPIGLLIFGLSVHFDAMYAAPCIGMAIANLGAQGASDRLPRGQRLSLKGAQ